MNTELKYKKFDDLLNDVAIDFRLYNNEGLIEPAQLIKIAQKINYDIGLRIHQTKEVLLEIEHNKTKLPDDFYVFNYGYYCHQYKIEDPYIKGRQTENVIVPKNVFLNGELCNRCQQTQNDCMCNVTYSVECQTGEKIFVQVHQKINKEYRIYEHTERIYISADSGKHAALENHKKSGYIKNGYIYTNFDCGKILISYQGALEDENGNLLVLDHPMINEYYEYALKERILENLYIEGEDVAQKLQYIKQQLREARKYALTIVNTPDFAEMLQLWTMNRKAQYSKYYNQFKSNDVPYITIPKR
jgi:hypothetical protein